MKISLFTLVDTVPSYGSDYRPNSEIIKDLPEIAQMADELDFDTFWVPEHHGDSFSVLPTPGTMLGYIAARTKRIKLGTACVVLPLNQPLRIAAEYAVLDQLSKGRIKLGFGRGYDQAEYKAFGVSYDRSRDLLREGIEIIRHAWEGKPFKYLGTEHCIPEDFCLNQLPLQANKPEMYMAMWSRGTLELAAQLGTNAMFTPFAATMAFGGLDIAIEEFKKLAKEHGHSANLKTSCSYYCAIAQSKKEEDRYRERLLRLLKALIPALPQDRSMVPPHYLYLTDIAEKISAMKLENIGDSSIAVGSAEKVIEILKKVEAAGIDEVLLNIDFGGSTLKETTSQMEVLAKEVVKYFHDKHQDF